MPKTHSMIWADPHQNHEHKLQRKYTGQHMKVVTYIQYTCCQARKTEMLAYGEV